MEAVLRRYGVAPFEDRELVEEVQSGDRNAFNRLMVKYQNKVYSIASRMLKNSEEAKDITQDVFFSVYSSIKRFQGNSKFSTWLYRIVINACINRLKSKSKGGFDKGKELKEGLASDDSGFYATTGMIERPDRQLERKTLSSAIENEISRLPEENRAVIILRDVEGLSYEEIETILSIPSGTVKSRLHRGRMELKEKLSKFI